MKHAEFGWDIEPLQAAVGCWEKEKRRSWVSGAKFGTIQWFKSARAAASSGCLNLYVKHWSLGRFNTGFL